MTLATRWPLVLALVVLLAGCAPATLDTTRLEAAIERFERAAAQAEAAAAQAEASARQAELAAQAAAADAPAGRPAVPGGISPAQAIERAEAFVRVNGYTDAPADRAAISAESLEWTSDIDQILAERRGTLKPRAYGYWRDAGGYAVLFQYATGGDQLGRAVMMDLDGGGLRIMHQDALLQGSSVVRAAPTAP